ncbi:MAG: peptide chain release factor N(5)-glutamine methyltransferase [Candidatus Acetothermia bacterium]|nr:peptide chain release factor N(5)-glutamine methyltransferase [Candidatus Acetothermia bacterium]
MTTTKAGGTTRVRGAVAAGYQTLAAAGIPAPAREARRLLALAIGAPYLLLGPDDPVPVLAHRRYLRLLAARARRVPLPLLEGGTGFLDFEVAVRPGVFIPRPETEELAERAIRILQGFPFPPAALDLGTGTGVLAIALARARPDARVVAVDVDGRAVACARGNVRRLGLDRRIEVRRSDWFSRVSERSHLVVSNPPYVPTGDIPRLDPEVRRFEARRAVDGGPDGLSAVRALLSQVGDHLWPGGAVLVEIGHGQGTAVLQFARRCPGLVEMAVKRDLAGKERFFVGRCG